MKDDYSDILNLEHPVSKRHPPLSAKSRAAQFLPFAALTGYESLIEETGRLTEQRRELDESVKVELDQRLRELFYRYGSSAPVCITYFQPDDWKEGGACIQAEGRIRRLDETGRRILMEDGSEIPMDQVVDIYGGNTDEEGKNLGNEDRLL